METRTILIVACLVAWSVGVAYWKQRKDLRHAAKIFADRAGREAWWKVRLRSSFVDKENEEERQRQILETESSFIRYFVAKYGNPNDYDEISRTTGAPE